MKPILHILSLVLVLLGPAQALELDQALSPHLEEMSIYHKGADGSIQVVLYDDTVAVMKDGGDPKIAKFPEGSRQELDRVRSEVVKFFNTARVLGKSDAKAQGRFTVTIGFRSVGMTTTVLEDFPGSSLSKALHELLGETQALASSGTK